MKTVVALFLSTIALRAFGQPSELVCFNPPPIPADPVAMQGNTSDLFPYLEKASEMTVAQLDGLSIEEAAAAVPEILNTTAFTLFIEAFDTVTDDDFTSIPGPGEFIVIAFQSIVNTTNGMKIMEQAVQDAENFARTLTLSVSNFDPSCIDNPTVFFVTIGAAMVQDILQEPFRDSFVDIFNATVVGISIQNNYTETVISVLEPLLESLDQASDIIGDLGSLLSLVPEDTINVALSSALEGSGLVVEPESIAAILSGLYARVQSSFELDGPEFISFLGDMYKNILDALK